MIRYNIHCECGNDTYEKEWDDNDKPIWRCNNCFKETKRTVRKYNGPPKGSKKWWQQRYFEISKEFIEVVPYWDFYHKKQIREKWNKLTKWEWRYHVTEMENTLAKHKEHAAKKEA